MDTRLQLRKPACLGISTFELQPCLGFRILNCAFSRGGAATHGSALIAVLGLMTLLLPLGTFVALQARMDLLMQRNLRAEIEAFYVAEAGIEHAVAEIMPGTSFDAVLAGPDRVEGTADDGVFPFSEGPPAPFPAAPLRYDVHVARRQDGWLDVTSSGSGRNGAMKAIAAIVKRAPLPFTPAALYVDNSTAVALGSADLIVSGLDHGIGDVATVATGTAAAIAALATSPDAEPELRQLLAGNAERLVGAGESPSIATTLPPDVQALLTACTQLSACVSVPPTVADIVALGSVGAPQIALANDLDVGGQLSGAGVLVVRGTLHVSGTLAFTGLVVALGGIICESSSDVQVMGALWRTASPDPRLYLNGHGVIAYSSAALAAADSAFPGLLPHAAVVAGWQETL
jgi:hypothetical protein